MSYTFSLTTKPTTPFLEKLSLLLQKTPTIQSEKTYNEMIARIIALTKTYPLPKNQGDLFSHALREATTPYPLCEKTPWGGVSIQHVDTAKDSIRKLLVIKQFGLLGFEIHKEKVEKLRVLEGVCFFIASRHKATTWKKGHVSITLATPDSKITLAPLDEHGIIALTNCVIEETSTNHLKDLTYVFEVGQVL